ncbi:MAG: histidine biosynthesis bifunctional protein HisIE [Bacteroidia bacterium]|nr:MAG: histidine biosynthesis bifunctional protein HisIE [Bacteroidia bacterium]
MQNIDFNKCKGLIPVIIQHYLNQQVLMLGFMNEEAYQKTIQEKKVTFFSRSKNRLWTKGETSGNFLIVKEIYLDCDQDTLLIKAEPIGPTCHRGTVSCFDENYSKGFLYELQYIQNQRIESQSINSYTYKLYEKGINKLAQKVGEEAVELVIEAKDNNIDLFKNEAADLLYHFLLLLKAKNLQLEDIEEVLRKRHEKK